MPKLKKVDYIVGEIYYWDCPNCEYMNKTNSLNVFGKCKKCKTKVRWGVDKDTLEECKKGYGGHDFCVVNSNTGIINCGNCGKEKPAIDQSKMDYIEKGAGIDGSFGICLGIVLFIVAILLLHFT